MIKPSIGRFNKRWLRALQDIFVICRLAPREATLFNTLCSVFSFIKLTRCSVRDERMVTEKRKRLIEPKVRLLLWIYLHGIKDETNWLAKLSRAIDYGTGNIESQLEDLWHKNMIEGPTSITKGPPYRISEEGKKFLQPILFTMRIGMATSIWVALWAIIYFLVFLNQPILMIVFWLPLLIVSFIILALVLIFYPYILLRLGKISY